MPEASLDELVGRVCAGGHYAGLHPGLVRRVAQEELSKGRSLKEAVKTTRSRLHQAGGAYLDHRLDWAALEGDLDAIPPGDDARLLDFCRQAMALHASTAERLPILEAFYAALLEGIPAPRSVLDAACGLNPLALPWMRLPPDVIYRACDIYAGQVCLLNAFFARAGVRGEAFLCDLTRGLEAPVADLGLLFKTLPCLEQLEKGSALRLLEAFPARVLLVTFPAQSLGGREKGMLQNYSQRFDQMCAGKPWRVQRFEFPGELAFRVFKES